MRLGGPVFKACADADQWAAEIKRLGYSAAYCPIEPNTADITVDAYKQAAAKANIIIAEVGAWCNPLSADTETRTAALRKCQNSLALADRIEARCCVNIAGSRGSKWDGPHALDLTDDTFDMIVESVRAIIDAVKPRHTFYTLETMPWMYPDSIQSYVDLVKAIDRKAFAVHFDPANLICSPQRFFTNGTIIREFCHKLGPWIRSCHGKDIAMEDRFMTHINEVQPGLGRLDYQTLLTELNKLTPDTPLMLEHLPNAEEYALAADYVRAAAALAGVTLIN